MKRWTRKFFGLCLLPLLGLSCLLLLQQGCGKNIACGAGTKLVNDTCVPMKSEGTTNESTGEPTPDGNPSESANPESQEETSNPPEPPPEAGPETPVEEIPEEKKGPKVGEKCDPKNDTCAQGPCLKEKYCTGSCKKEEDCPVGMQCRQISHQKPDGSYETITGCVRPTQANKLCKTDKDCASQDRCMPVLNAKGDDIENRCQQAIAGGQDFGKACNPNTPVLCKSGICLNNTFCSSLCETDDDCQKPMTCSQVGIGLPNGKTATIKACAPENVKCERDSDCPAGNVCKAAINSDQSSLNFRCAPKTTGGAEKGSGCDPANVGKHGCYNDICVQDGFCLALCKSDADCGDGFRCADIDTKLPGGTFKFKGCAPKRIPCLHDKECPKDFSCALALNAKGDKIEPVCQFKRLFRQPNGAPCNPASNKASERCNNNMCLSDNYCSALCKKDDDCPKGTVCRSLDVQIAANNTQTIMGCARP